MNVALTIFLIFGTIFGAGFSSGNEVVVFFSRFGNMSYLYILLAGFLMYFVLYFFLRHGKKIASTIENNKILNALVIFITIIFCASMYAGIENLLCYFPRILHVFLSCIVIVGCVIVVVKGMGGLEKTNMFLMPVLSILFLCVLCLNLTKTSDYILEKTQSFFGFFYSPLYVALNTCMSVFVLSKMGEKLSKKQAQISSLFSALIVFGFLILSNFVLERNPECFASEMPILYICDGNFAVFFVEFFVILAGCFTTLISLCFTLKNSFKKIIKNNYLCNLSAVFLPYFVGQLGFSEIISFLYPICSILSIFIILFSIFFFKQTDKIIHSKSKETKNGC